MSSFSRTCQTLHPASGLLRRTWKSMHRAPLPDTRLEALGLMRKVRDRLDREYAQPRALSGVPACLAALASRPGRNQEAPIPEEA